MVSQLKMGTRNERLQMSLEAGLAAIRENGKIRKDEIRM